MAKPGATGIKRIINATGYSLRGFTAALKHESAFRQELALAAILTPVAIYLGQNNIERSILIGSLLVVLIVELLNSAIEAIVDRVGHEHHELSGRAKDMGSAAVFISLANVVIVWGIIIFM
ncbi:MAG TPA: diacylglycerol kinase [Gammaproteobacteria bacterium]